MILLHISSWIFSWSLAKAKNSCIKSLLTYYQLKRRQKLVSMKITAMLRYYHLIRFYLVVPLSHLYHLPVLQSMISRYQWAYLKHHYGKKITLEKKEVSSIHLYQEYISFSIIHLLGQIVDSSLNFFMSQSLHWLTNFCIITTIGSKKWKKLPIRQRIYFIFCSEKKIAVAKEGYASVCKEWQRNI